MTNVCPIWGRENWYPFFRIDEGHTRPKTTMKNATNYIEEAIRFKRTTAPDTLGTHRAFDVFSGTSSLEVLERLLHILDKTGIPYSHSNFIITVGTASRSCTIEIYRNKGTHAKTRIPCSFNTSTIVPDTDTFIVSMWDTTRYFSQLFRHIIKNYSVEEIPPFTHEDLNYGLYCPYSEEIEDSHLFHEECSQK